MTTRIFVKGIDISDMVSNFGFKTDVVEHTVHGVIDKVSPVGQTITLELHASGTFSLDNDELHIGEIPTKEFIAEMVKLRLKRG